MLVALIKSYTNKPWRSPETYQLIEDSLREKWPVESISPQSPESLIEFLDNLQSGHGPELFVFNIAEYLDEENKLGFLPKLLDDHHIAHLGSKSEIVNLGLNKAKLKQVLLDNHIPTPQFFVGKNGRTSNRENASEIGFPLFVKPLLEGGHIGISDDSIVHNHVELEDAITQVFDDQDQPALVEEFITGKGMREFSVGILDGKQRIFTPVEIDFESMETNKNILSFDAAENDLEKIMLVQDKKVHDEIIELTERTFDSVGAQDYSRVDIRMDSSGLYVLEINIMPGLGPQSFIPQAAKDIHGLDYNQLIQNLVENSLIRQGF